ncbi:MAG: beta-propeller domain-containing protein [Bacillota bacterium]
MKENDFYKKIIEENMPDKERIRQRAISNGRQIKPSKKYIKRKALAIAMVTILVLVIGFVTSTLIYVPQNYDDVSPRSVRSYSDIEKTIEKFNKEQNNFSIDSLFGMFRGATSEDMNSIDEDAAESDFSTTNIQTEGMDEGDIVKTDGEYIYKLNTTGCAIVEVDNGQMDIVSSIELENYVPYELYINDDLLIMVGGLYENNIRMGGGDIEPMIDCFSYVHTKKTDIRIYDISEKNSPELQRQITMDGAYHTSRLDLQNRDMYFIINYSFYNGQEEGIIPEIIDSAMGDEERLIPEENLYIYDDIKHFGYMILGKINLDEPEGESLMKAYMGLGGEIYMSSDNIFVATYDQDIAYDKNIFGWVRVNDETRPTTRIVKISLDNLEQTAYTRVDGRVKDRYSMDEYEGYLRVATTVDSASNLYNNLYVLKSDLSEASSVENIAPGEMIYATRFNEDKASIITFDKIDPYFVFDLSDPYNPVITGELKEDGVSYYIHYIEDTDYTIGIGRMSELQVNNGWEFVVWTGLKVTLYDNSSGTAVNIASYVIEGSCHAEILHNPKALLYDKDKGLVAFSYERWYYENNMQYYNSMEQGLAMFKFDLENPEDEEKLIYRGTLTNLEDEINPHEGFNNYYDRYLSFIERGVRVGDYIYTISDRYIVSYDINTLEEINELYLHQG